MLVQLKHSMYCRLVKPVKSRERSCGFWEEPQQVSEVRGFGNVTAETFCGGI
jgi:hypothetical protein